MCQTQAPGSDLRIYSIFVPQKVPHSKISDDVIACDLWFAPTPIPNPGNTHVRAGGGDGRPSIGAA